MTLVSWLADFVDLGQKPQDDPMGEDSDDDSDDELFNEIVYNEDSFNEHHRSLFLSFLTQLNYHQLDSDTVFKLAGVISCLNEPSLISRLAFNIGFQAKLLKECFDFSPSLMSNVKFMDRVRRSQPVTSQGFGDLAFSKGHSTFNVRL